MKAHKHTDAVVLMFVFQPNDRGGWVVNPASLHSGSRYVDIVDLVVATTD